MGDPVHNLADLISRVEAAEEGSPDLDALVCLATGYATAINPKAPEFVRIPDEDAELYTRAPPVTASLDAAIALCERVLPGWHYTLSYSKDHPAQPLGLPFYADCASAAWIDGDNQDEHAEAFAFSLPLAMCLALLRALHSPATPADRDLGASCSPDIPRAETGPSPSREGEP